jgi:hypothetical protein
MIENKNEKTYFSRHNPRLIQGDNKLISKQRFHVRLILCVLVVLFAMPLFAAEKKKIKLPDGLYMYDSSIERLQDECVRVGFGKYFIVRNNTIYSSKEAIRKFGIAKLNKLFTENKKYKILSSGGKIGEIYNIIIEKYDDEMDWNYEEELYTKNVKEGPLYGAQGGYGSVVRYIAVPEEYKEVQKKTFTTISQEEVDKISKLAKEKLLPLLINRKGFSKYKINEMELYKENLLFLDKISYRNDDLYIGRYQYAFKTAKTAYRFDIIFSARRDNFHVVTTDYEDGDLVAGYMKIYGMLDVDGCGADELIIEKEAPREDETTIWLEIHKQKPGGNWTLIKVVKTRRIL